MRFMRTPGKSIVSKSSARNVLRTVKSQGSGMNVISFLLGVNRFRNQWLLRHGLQLDYVERSPL